MQVHGFDMHRVFISGPGDLEREREAVRELIAEVNERAMESRILLVSVGLTNDDQIVGMRAAVSENVRAAAYFVQIFEDDWGPKNLFRKTFFVAVDSFHDTALPMREIVVCLKDAPRETDPEILAFRKELEDQPGVRVVRFSSVENLREQLRPVCADWVDAIRTQTASLH